jgi:hypothetical protein
LLALLVIAALPFGSVRPAAGADCDFAPRLTFGQTLVVSDFDNDGKPDWARVAVDGTRKTIAIQPGVNGPISWLHFEAPGASQGSLFTQDIDHDGDADLIWTDLFHSDSVVVWLGDGTGRFERAGAGQFTQGFTLDGSFLTAPANPPHEQASDDETNSHVTLECTARCVHARAPATIANHSFTIILPVGAEDQIPTRGPPSLLS